MFAGEGDDVCVAAVGYAEGFEHAFGVIPGGGWLLDGCGSLCEHSGEEDGTFDLGGGDGEFVGDWA